MEWKELREKIYYQDGSYRDILVRNTTRENWKRWADYVNAHYKTTLLIFEKQTKTNNIEIANAFSYWDGAHDNCATASIFIDSIQVNAHFFEENEIENDITPTEINSIEDHFKLMTYLTGLSNALDKEVVLTPENEPETVLILVKNNDIFINLR